MAGKLSTYIKETKAELTHVKWLTRDQVIRYSLAVIVVSLVLSAFLGAFDYLFAYLVRTIIF